MGNSQEVNRRYYWKRARAVLEKLLADNFENGACVLLLRWPTTLQAPTRRQDEIRIADWLRRARRTYGGGFRYIRTVGRVNGYPVHCVALDIQTEACRCLARLWSHESTEAACAPCVDVPQAVELLTAHLDAFSLEGGRRWWACSRGVKR